MLKDLSKIVNLCKRRGFVFPSSEIYGGINASWDFGPLGSIMKQNIKSAWWHAMTRRRDICGVDCAIFMHPDTWKASGHIDGFSDPLVDCIECKHRFRSDNTESYLIHKTCPKCGSKNLSNPRQFNLMFKTQMGPVENDGSIVYLRPETAQGIFVNFLNCQQTTRYKLPFGIAQIGKAFRNEITPGNFIFRTREFEQMEMQYFVKPDSDDKYFAQWRADRMSFYHEYGICADNLRFKDHLPDELAHYAKCATDIEYRFPMGFSELEGIHNRGNFDLSQHMEHSKNNLEYFDEIDSSKYLPYVIETSVGCDRLFLAFLCDAYYEESLNQAEGNQSKNDADVRVVLKLHPKIAPIKAAILPLSKKEQLCTIADNLYNDLSKQFDLDFDISGSIGKRYRRQDEIGTPFCITVDFDSINDQAATVRHRDTMQQLRINFDNISSYINQHL